MKPHQAFRDEIESVTFPSIPHVLLRFLKLVEDDRTPLSDLADLVSRDPSLSARFLTVANSPALCRREEVTSIEQCMVTLGTRLARTLAACLAIQDVFSRTAGETQYDYKGFWKHSLKVAETARGLATLTGYPDPSEAYLSGLIHDIGILLLLGSEGERYGDLLRRSIDESILIDIERAMIGSDHAAAAARLVDHWQVTSFMSDAILFHHRSPSEIVTADHLSRIVWSAHVVCDYSEKLELKRVEHSPDLTAARTALGIATADIEEVRSTAFAHVAALAATFGADDVQAERSLPFPANLVSTTTRGAEYGRTYSELDDSVQNMALMQALQHNFSDISEEEELLLTIRESARILFGLGRMAFFFTDHNRGVMAGSDFSGQPAQLQRMSIPLSPPHSLAANVAEGTVSACTLDTSSQTAATLTDVQIAHSLYSEGVLYLPLSSRSGAIGIVAYGVSAAQYSRIQCRLPLMETFCGLAAASIAAFRSRSTDRKPAGTDDQQNFMLQARKAIHEAGNPLSIIKNYLKIITGKLPAEHNVQQELLILQEEVNRVVDILQHLQPQCENTGVQAIPGGVCVNDVIEAMLILYAAPLFEARGIILARQLDQGLQACSIDQDSIKQILLNLWKNAAEALPPGGEVTVSTAGEKSGDGRPFVRICIRDNGPGLPPDVLQHLFQPLRPDRRPGHSGLGLSIVAALVRRAGGHISCESGPGNGTTFTTLLPCQTAGAL